MSPLLKMCVCSIDQSLSDSAILWPVARQAPFTMRFSRQEYWSGLPFSPGNPPDPGIESMFPASPSLADGFFTTEPPGDPWLLVSFLPLSFKFVLNSHHVNRIFSDK